MIRQAVPIVRLRSVADTGERVVVSFGPEHAALEQRQVEEAMNEAYTLMREMHPAPVMGRRQRERPAPRRGRRLERALCVVV